MRGARCKTTFIIDLFSMRLKGNEEFSSLNDENKLDMLLPLDKLPNPPDILV